MNISRRARLSATVVAIALAVGASLRAGQPPAPAQPAAARPAPLHSPDIHPDRTVTFRLPNGGDQEALSPLLAENEAAAMSGLLARCLLRIGTQTEIDEEDVARLTPLARLEIERRMAEVAPQVDLLMEATCPECGREFRAPFDLQQFFFGELRTDSRLLYQEVHYLAYHYHWSEREIMGMTRGRRRRYIDVLSDEIERINESV